MTIFFCNKLFLALTDVTVVALTDASVKVVLYKRCTFCPVFFALSTTEEASHSWGETFGDQKRHRLVCGKLLENSLFQFEVMSLPQCQWSKASYPEQRLLCVARGGGRHYFKMSVLPVLSRSKGWQCCFIGNKYLYSIISVLSRLSKKYR